MDWVQEDMGSLIEMEILQYKLIFLCVPSHNAVLWPYKLIGWFFEYFSFCVVFKRPDAATKLYTTYGIVVVGKFTK